MSVSALHLAVLDDGRWLTLLDDRGWGVSGPSDIWRRTSVEEIETAARMVVGPGERTAAIPRRTWRRTNGQVSLASSDVRAYSSMPNR